MNLKNSPIYLTSFSVMFYIKNPKLYLHLLVTSTRIYCCIVHTVIRENIKVSHTVSYMIYFLWKDISFCINKMAWKVKKIFKEALDCYMYLKLRYWRFFMFSEKPSNFSIWLSRRCKLARCSNLSSPSRVLMVFAA